MKVLMFYETKAESLPLARQYFQAHRERLEEFKIRGVLLMAGPYGNPPVGALGIFTSLESAEEFAKGDPFVLNGIVSNYYFHEWNEVLA